MARRKAVLIAGIMLWLTMLPACATVSPRLAEPRVQTNIHSAELRGKVVVLLVDSLLSPSLERLVREEQVPALSFLLRHGVYKRDVVSAFPTMSVTIDSTMLTGEYPDRHNVPGLLWFDVSQRRMVNYGDSVRIFFRQKLPEWFADTVYHVNHTHLSRHSETLYEALKAKGVRAASINGLIYRGSVKQKLTVPRSAAAVLNTPRRVAVEGPDLMGYGALRKVAPDLPDGPFHSFGFTDVYSVESLISLIRRQELPDVTLAYFPDMDAKLHKHGPNYRDGIKRFDQELQRLLNAFGNWQQALRTNTFVLVGDSGVTSVAREAKTALIDVDEALRGFSLYRYGRKAAPEDDVAVAVNGRMCYVYSLSAQAPVPELVGRFKRDQRIDLIAWKEGQWIHVMQGGSGRRFSFRSGNQIGDVYGKRWDIKGDAGVLDLRRDPRTGLADSKTYPDGLRRLAGAMFSHAGDFLVLTARPGCELTSDGSPHHVGGGSHGSLHRLDSLVPLVVAGAGADADIKLPSRMADMKAYILALATRSRDVPDGGENR